MKAHRRNKSKTPEPLVPNMAMIFTEKWLVDTTPTSMMFTCSGPSLKFIPLWGCLLRLPFVFLVLKGNQQENHHLGRGGPSEMPPIGDIATPISFRPGQLPLPFAPDFDAADRARHLQVLAAGKSKVGSKRFCSRDGLRLLLPHAWLVVWFLGSVHCLGACKKNTVGLFICGRGLQKKAPFLATMPRLVKTSEFFRPGKSNPDILLTGMG